MCEINAINAWNKDAGRSHDYFNVRSVALHTGLQLEELGEKLEAMGLLGAANSLKDLSRDFKEGMWDTMIKRQDEENSTVFRMALLDADADLFVVTVGSGQAQGADYNGAVAEVLRSNDSKRQEDGTLKLDANGKIVKGPYYKEPNLWKFINKGTEV